MIGPSALCCGCTCELGSGTIRSPPRTWSLYARRFRSWCRPGARPPPGRVDVDRRTLTQMLRRPTRRETVQTLGAGVGIAAICWYFGVDVWHAIVLGCAITVAALAAIAGSAAPEARDLSWRPGKRASSEGSRNDVASLSSSLHVGWGRRRPHGRAAPAPDRSAAPGARGPGSAESRRPACDRAPDRYAGLPNPQAPPRTATEPAQASVLPRRARSHRLQPLSGAAAIATLATPESPIHPIQPEEGSQ